MPVLGVRCAMPVPADVLFAAAHPLRKCSLVDETRRCFPTKAGFWRGMAGLGVSYVLNGRKGRGSDVLAIRF